jgi:signal transduction histidine kinase
MRAEVEEISHTTMHRRVHEPGTDDEVDRLAVTMNEMLDRLESASERQRRFVSDASHELKTPLATIRTSVEVALRNPDTADWPATAQQVLDADRSMADLVANLLDLARLEEDGEANPLPASAPAVDLEEVVMAVVAHRPDETQSGGVLAGRVRGDRGDLERLVRNLIDNAERYGSGRVVVGLAEHQGTVRLAVADDGPGIPADDRERVFDRFTRLDDSRSSSAGGTGLGLAIVRAIAERHGGSVRVDDGPLGGAELVVTLPAP